MALPPSIPTSFVPRSLSMRPTRLDFGGAFFFVGIAIFVIAVIGAGTVFGYKSYLEGVERTEKALVKADIASIDPGTIEGFVALQNRLNSLRSLLNNHILLTSLFDEIGALTPQTVRFSTLTFIAGEGTGYKVSAAGTAKSFNTLAVASASFNDSKQLHNVIFSSFAINAKEGTIGFSFTADVDPALVTRAQAAQQAPL